jgi:hypothetical protein
MFLEPSFLAMAFTAGFRSANTRLTSFLSYFSAVAKPIPAALPVIIAVFPAKEKLAFTPL